MAAVVINDIQFVASIISHMDRNRLPFQTKCLAECMEEADRMFSASLEADRRKRAFRISLAHNLGKLQDVTTRELLEILPLADVKITLEDRLIEYTQYRFTKFLDSPETVN